MYGRVWIRGSKYIDPLVRRFMKLVSRKYARRIQLVRSTIRKEDDLRVEQVLGVRQGYDL
jgi:hypothetical protein